MAPAGPADGVECVYRTVAPAALAAAGRSMQASGADDRQAFAALRAAADACARRLGWSQQQGLDSALYAMSREGYDQVLAALEGWGVRTPVVAQIVATMTPQQRADVLAHKDAMEESVVVPIILASEIGRLPAERQRAAARMVGIGVVALVTRNEIAARFRR